MIVAHISDTHIALDTADANQRIEDFEITIADINALDPPPDAILHTGDITHNGRPDEYAEAVRILDGAHASVYVIPGNKDNRANLRMAFAPRGFLDPSSEFIDYAIEEYPVRLIAADTLSTRSNKGDFCLARSRRLIERIDAETTKPIAVFTHHPPFLVPLGPDQLNFETYEMMMRLRSTLQNSGRVVAVFSGHVHRGTAGHVGNIGAMVVPSVATTLRQGDYPSHMWSRPVYHVHRFNLPGSFATQSRIVEVPRTLVC